MPFKKIVKKRSKYGTLGLVKRAQEEIVTKAYRRPVVRSLIKPFSGNYQPRKWIFICGCYNSGTTLLHNIIASHSGIAYLPREGVRFTSLLPQPEDLGWTRMWLKCPQHMEISIQPDVSAYEQILADWGPMWSDKSLELFLEKSITNVTRMQWLDQCFPDAYFIGIWRNGYCVAEGIRRRAKPKEKTNYDSDSYPISLTGQQWVDANQRLIKGASKVKNYVGLSYEDFIQNPVKLLQDIFDFMSIARPELTIKEDKLIINQKSFRLQNQNANSISRLNDTDLSNLNPVIETMMEKLNYKIITSNPDQPS